MATGTVERIVFETDAPVGGGGDAVLMIHGLGGTSNVWTPLLQALPQFFKIRFDLPGSGRSQRCEGPLTIARFVQAARRVLETQGIERAHVMGHSLGTIVALHLAVTVPAAVRSLALFGPLLAPPDPARQALRARAEQARRDGIAGMQTIADALVQAATAAETKARRAAAVAFVRESVMRQDPDGYARTAEALAAAEPADAARVGCPTLLVTGDEDAVAPPQSVRALAEKIPRSQVEVLRGCGHWTPVEQPEACIDLARRFYARRF